MESSNIPGIVMGHGCLNRDDPDTFRNMLYKFIMTKKKHIPWYISVFQEVISKWGIVGKRVHTWSIVSAWYTLMWIHWKNVIQPGGSSKHPRIFCTSIPSRGNYKPLYTYIYIYKPVQLDVKLINTNLWHGSTWAFPLFWAILKLRDGHYWLPIGPDLAGYGLALDAIFANGWKIKACHANYKLVSG